MLQLHVRGQQGRQTACGLRPGQHTSHITVALRSGSSRRGSSRRGSSRRAAGPQLAGMRERRGGDGRHEARVVVASSGHRLCQCRQRRQPAAGLHLLQTDRQTGSPCRATPTSIKHKAAAGPGRVIWFNLIWCRQHGMHMVRMRMQAAVGCNECMRLCIRAS